MIIGTCPSCQRRFKLPEAGRKYRCNACGERIEILSSPEEPVSSRASSNVPMQPSGAIAGKQPAARKFKPRIARRRAPRRPPARLPIGRIIAQSFSMYATNFLLFTSISMIIFGPIILFRLLDVSQAGGLKEYGISIVTYLLQQLTTGAIIYGVFRRLKNERAGMGKCLSVALKRLVHLLLTLLLIGLLLLLIVVLPLFVASFILVKTNTGVLFPLITFGALVLGIYVYAGYFATAPIVVVEKATSFEALRRSLLLTRGNRLRIVGVLLFFSVINWIIGLVLTKTIVGNPGATQLAEQSQGEYRTYLLLMLGTSLLFMAIGAVAQVLVYYNLRVQIEGADERELASVFD